MADFIRVPFAVEGDQQSIPQELQTDGNVSMQTGFTYDYERDPTSDPGAKDVPRPETNWLYNLITTAIHQYQTEGTFPFITAAQNAGKPFPYRKYARCVYEGEGVSGIFESLADANTALPSDTTKWKKIVNAGDITIKTTAPLSGGGVLSKDLTLGLTGTLAIANGGTGNTAGLATSATKLATARTLRTNLASTGTASFDGTANITPGVTGTLPIGNGGTGNTSGLAASAAKLATARSLRTNLASTSVASFDGSANITPGVTGTLPIANGGTGNTAGLAASATKLATARAVRTNLASTSVASFDGSANITPGVTGTLPLGNGGTGAATAAQALINIGAAPKPRTLSASGVGVWYSLQVDGSKFTLPSGGTWAWSATIIMKNLSAGRIVSGVNAGGFLIQIQMEWVGIYSSGG